VLKAAKAGVVKAVKVKAGDRLKVDQIIVEFETAEDKL
jgi:pyruvate/2-oxoglutarate dehydrogenase complex dihydrolipoamide acyltransferase (E2) component